MYRIKVSAHNEDVFRIIWKPCQTVHSWANIIGVLNEFFVRPGIFGPKRPHQTSEPPGILSSVYRAQIHRIAGLDIPPSAVRN